jgi:Flp pilus assembly protein TadB
MQSSSRVLLLCSVLVLAVSFTGTGFAQSINDAAKARRDQLTDQERAGNERRQNADQQALEKAELRARKVKACKAQAKQRGLHWLERRRFIKTCAAG